MRKRFRKDKNGFTMVELVVVIVILGVLAGFGVPRFLQSVERSKAAEAFAYLSVIGASQERYLAREGTYAGALNDLDPRLNEPRYFRVGSIAPGDSKTLRDSWSLTLTRFGSPAGYGPYTVTFTKHGYDRAHSTIDEHPRLQRRKFTAAGGVP